MEDSDSHFKARRKLVASLDEIARDLPIDLRLARAVRAVRVYGADLDSGPSLLGGLGRDVTADLRRFLTRTRP